MPALVSAELWDTANKAMAKNKKLSKKNSKERYLLRGLIKCTLCGLGFSGTTRDRKKSTGRFYRCNGQLSSYRVRAEDRCHSKMLDGDYLEKLVWEDVRSFLMNPGDALEQTRSELVARRSQGPDLDRERRVLGQKLDVKETEKGRVLTLYRRGSVDLAEAERELDAINREEESLRGMLAAFDAQEEILRMQLHQVDEAEHLAEVLRDRLEQIERDDDWDTKRQLVELLVNGISVVSEGTGRGKQATITIDYAFTRPKVAVDYPESSSPSFRPGADRSA
jgi:site-specific DNA recombinase